MKTAIFHNITNKPFVGYWDGKGKKYEAGARKLLPDYLAKHYATHLTNQILIEREEYTSTSPKFPEQVPKFMEVLNQCYIPQDDEEEEDVEMPVQNVPSSRIQDPVSEKEPQYIPPVDGDDEDSFEGLSDQSSEMESPAKPNLE